MALRATKGHEKSARVSALPVPGPWPLAPVFQGSGLAGIRDRTYETSY